MSMETGPTPMQVEEQRLRAKQKHPQKQQQAQAGGETAVEQIYQQDIEDIINMSIARNAIFVFSDESNNESKQVKEFLMQQGVRFDSLELQNFSNKDMYLEGLRKKSNRLNLPAVFINSSPIGGLADLEFLARDGSLERVIASTASPMHVPETAPREEITKKSVRALDDQQAKHRNMPPPENLYWQQGK